MLQSEKLFLGEMLFLSNCKRLCSCCKDSGMAAVTSKGSLCEVVCTVEAEVGDGECLYVSGEPAELGGRKPEMAVQMFAMGHSNLWKAEVWVVILSCYPLGFFKGDLFTLEDGVKTRS